MESIDQGQQKEEPDSDGVDGDSRRFCCPDIILCIMIHIYRSTV
jgi:hypothetical protein